MIHLSPFLPPSFLSISPLSPPPTPPPPSATPPAEPCYFHPAHIRRCTYPASDGLLARWLNGLSNNRAPLSLLPLSFRAPPCRRVLRGGAVGAGGRGSGAPIEWGPCLSTRPGSLLRRLWGFMLPALGLALAVINHPRLRGCYLRPRQAANRRAFQEPL